MKPQAAASSRLIITAYRTGSFSLPVIPAPASREWMTKTDGHFAYRCLPLRIANQNGWLVLNNFEITAVWSGLADVGAVSIKYGRGSSPPLVGSHFGDGILTWSLPFLFRTPAGFNLLIRGPANHPKDGVYPLEGIVETDWSSASFTMNWKITRPHTPVRFDIDEPICMIVPQRRGELEQFEAESRLIDCSPELKRQHENWSRSRRQYLKDLRSGSLGERDPGWQRHYFQGVHVTDEQEIGDHQLKLSLRPFKEN